MRKYELPDFIPAKVTQSNYEKWLRGKAAAHVRRDRKRGNVAATIETYKGAIRRAVIHSAGRDAYRGEQLVWALMGRYSAVEITWPWL